MALLRPADDIRARGLTPGARHFARDRLFRLKSLFEA
jgi:hypothetical protein